MSVRPPDVEPIEPGEPSNRWPWVALALGVLIVVIAVAFFFLNRSRTVNVTVEGTPLLNQTDTTNGYTLGAEVIPTVPLGTGSFTQLAILSPGVSADFLSGSGSNEGLGNQGIVANGQRDTSNLFTFNGVNANNLFNGNSTSNISDSRFTLNTGEIFGVGGQVQTNSSVFDAIGQALPTPPVETIEEVHVTTSMYDASMGSASGATVGGVLGAVAAGRCCSKNQAVPHYHDSHDKFGPYRTTTWSRSRVGCQIRSRDPLDTP